VVQTFGNGLISQVECRLETGRTHQIRVHFSHKGYPLVGDQTYGSAKLKLLSSFPVDIQNEILNFKRQALHSVQIGFNHPVTHEFLEFKAPLPPDLDDLIKKLKVAKQA
jgi:23S rRNA pseudouridine1911/1915/1917 synthase